MIAYTKGKAKKIGRFIPVLLLYFLCAGNDQSFILHLACWELLKRNISEKSFLLTDADDKCIKEKTWSFGDGQLRCWTGHRRIIAECLVFHCAFSLNKDETFLLPLLRHYSRSSGAIASSDGP